MQELTFSNSTKKDVLDGNENRVRIHHLNMLGNKA